MRNLNTITITALLILILTCGYSFALEWNDPVYTRVKKGNEEYAAEKYDDARVSYQDALVDSPNSPEVNYNIGNVLYKNGNYKEAEEKFLNALQSSDPDLLADAHYNIGNCKFKTGFQEGDIKTVEESIMHYKEVLLKRPNDEDAKYNIEYIRRVLKQMATQQQKNQQQQNQEQQNQEQQQQNQDQQQQQQQQQSQSEKQEGEEDQQQQQGQEDQEKQDQGDQQQQQQQQGQQDQNQSQAGEQGEPKDGEEQQQMKAVQMTEEEAMQLLNSLSDEEKEQLKRKFRRIGANTGRVEKDW